MSASAMSNLGDGIALLAFPWLASLITRDAALIAIVPFAARLPWLLFSIPAGVIIDRADRRRLMIQADLLRLVLIGAVIGLILSLDALPLASPMGAILILAGLAFCLGLAEVIRDNAAQTALPSIVDKSQLEQANGQIWSVEQVMGSFVGPPLAGVLIAFALPVPFSFVALCMALSAYLLWSMVLPLRTAITHAPIWDDMRDGIRWLWDHKTLMRLGIMLGLLNFLTVMSVTILVLFAQDILGLTSVGYGVLLTAGALGGVLGGLIGPAIITRLGSRNAVIAAMCTWPIALMLIALTHSPWVVAFALFAETFAGLIWNIVTVSYRQRLIPDAILGRVNAIYRFLGWGGIPLGILFAGFLVSWFEPTLGRDGALRLPYWIAAFGSLGMLIYGLRRLRF